jgi:Bacteriophage HK97-gp10, putative tail-component
MAQAFTAKATIDGLQPYLERLAAFDKKAQKTITRKAVTAGGRPLIKAMRRQIPRSTDARLVPGLLGKSIGSKVKIYSSGIVVLVVGPRVGFKRNRKTGQRQQTKFSRAVVVTRVRRKGWQGLLLRRTQQKTLYQNPTQYAHLAGPARHEQWREKALAQAAEDAKQAMIDKFLAEIEAEA